MADDVNLVANVEVEIYDGEFFGVVAHEWEQCGRECVDARKCKALALFYIEIGVGRFDCSGGNVCPSYEAVVFVAKQVARGSALRYEEHGCMSASALIEFLEVCIAQDVHVVDKDGFVGGKQVFGNAQSAAGFEELFGFVGQADGGFVWMCGNVVPDLLCKVVDVDDDFIDSAVLKFSDGVVEQRSFCHGHKGFGHGVGQWFEAAAQSRC